MTRRGALVALVLAALVCAGCRGGAAVDAGSDAGRRRRRCDAATADAGADGAATIDAAMDATAPMDASLDAPTLDAPADGVTPTDASDAWVDPDAPADVGSDSPDTSEDTGEVAINGCTRAGALDLRGMASATVTFGGTTGIAYAPPCIVVDVGTVVTFEGRFDSHPLQGGVAEGGTVDPATSGPFAVLTSTGTSHSFTMDAAGTYPYFCTVHAWFGGMRGVVFVE